MRILNVDDQSENLYFLQSLLSGRGYQFLDAKNGREALDILKTEEVDLVISDILMPVMDGFALCREIRKNPKLKHIPFIVYTATYTGDKDAVLARKIGADDFIVKPCEPDELLERIDNALARKDDPHRFEQAETVDDETVLKLYNERLVRKLEEKMLEMETEVAERNKAMEALRRSEGILKTVQALEKMGGWVYYPETKEIYWTEEMYKLHDVEINSVSGEEAIRLSMSGYEEENQPKLQKYWDEILKNGTTYDLESWFVTPKGRKIFVHTGAVAQREGGKICRIIGTFHDITEKKEAEIRQNELTQQLRQAQKLDSIGQLAGGIAHDFNNILTVILGYTEEVLNSLHGKDPIRTEIEEINKAGLRAAGLTRQLLTFSRKQVIKPQLLDLNETIENLSKMLMRLIGEDIEFVKDLADDLPKIMADVGQIEQVIMNLVINAREAMQMGGTLSISTFAFSPDPAFSARHPMIKGDGFVVLKVKDTGCGMDLETKEHIFEPFFTTKAKGHGTGLGLPTVYGIIRQAGGSINVDSSPGKGSMFVIMLPTANGKNEVESEAKAPMKESRHDELVLIVEDDASIADLSAKMISRMGFNVVQADSADKAMVLIEDEGLRPHLIISDVVMPGLSGVELAAIMQFKHPEIKLLLMSGYTENIISQHGELDPGIPFLRKPFTRQELLEKIGEALKHEGPARAGSGA